MQGGPWRGSASCTPQPSLSPRGLGLVPPARSAPKATRVGTGGPPAGWHTGTPAPRLTPPLSAGRVLLPSPGHALPGQAALGTAGEGCRDGGSAPATRWGQDEGPARSCPSSSPPSPRSPGPPTGTARLYPPVMVAASRCLPVADPWDVGPVWGRAATGEAGLGRRWQVGRCWPGGVSRRTAVSSLAGVMWGGRLPWGEAPSSLAPWSSAGGQQSPFSGPCLGRRSC